MSEKYFIMHYPSSWGMGTNADMRLVSDKDIRRLIRIELDKSKSRQDDRFTGTWNDEVFCDSKDTEEIVEDVLHKRLTTCSTYAGVNDLVPVPEDIPVLIDTMTVKDTIYRICNQFLCVGDVIIGEGTFKRYIVDLKGFGDVSRCRGGLCYEFVGYDLKRVLSDGLRWDRDTLIKRYEKSLRRFSEKTSSDEKDGKYLADYVKDVMGKKEYEAYCREMTAKAERILERFRAVMPMKDDYISHIRKSTDNEYFANVIKHFTRRERRKRVDHSLLGFVSPVEYPEFGQIWHKSSDEGEYYTYSELFKKGDDIEWLTASENSVMEAPEDKGEILPFNALVPSFAGD